MRAKKVTALLISAVLATGLLAGCGSSGEGQGGESAEGSSGKIELEFFTQKREAADTFDKIIAEFNASQDEIVVTQNIVPDSTSVLMSRAATEDLPDIIQVGGMQDSNTMQFMKEGHFLDLTGMECLNQVVDNYQEAIKFKGKNYVVPISANFSGVYYNKDKFEEKGYTVPKTYDELIALAQKMQADAAKKFVEFAASKEMVQLYVDNDYSLPCMKDVKQIWADFASCNLCGYARGLPSGKLYSECAGGFGRGGLY